MPELEITPHPDEQRSLSELRSEFRSTALYNLQSQYAGHHPVGWNMVGDPTRSRNHYDAEHWSFELLHHLNAPVTQDFGLAAVPRVIAIRLSAQAAAALEHDSVTWSDNVSGVTDHDAPACVDVTSMSDDDLCEYVDTAIRESDRG